MTNVSSRLMLAVLAATLMVVPACVYPGSIDDPSSNNGGPDATPGSEPDADLAAPDAAPGTPDATPSNNALSFATDVYPILQASKANCTNCHSNVAGAIASFLPYNDGAAAVYQRLMTGGQRVNTGSPSSSLILQKPLMGSPVSHRAKIFTSTTDPRYVTILNWITAGAQP